MKGFEGGFDPRITPARPDLAAAHLRGRIRATRYAEGTPKRVVAGMAPVRHRPRHNASLDTEALFGERIMIYDSNEEGWSWGQAELDAYVGWLPTSALGDLGPPPTHRVAALRTFMFPGPDIKQPPITSLSMGSRVSVERNEGEFAVTDAGGFIYVHHLAPIDYVEPEFILTARRFLGVPYLWGGRSSLGIDCSGLVQIAMQAAGIECPRDSDMQARFGMLVPFGGDPASLRRGDLVCWTRHIGIVSEPGRIIHANAFHMQVAEESLSEAIMRIRQSGSDVTAIRRVGSIYAQ